MIAILGDTHFGAHSSSIVYHAHMEKFFTDFFKYIDENKIKVVLQLGDLFDVRKNINVLTLNFFRRVFLQKVLERDLTVYVLLGNHDIYFRESVSVSSVEEVLSPYPESFVLIREPLDVVLEQHSFLLVPWVCRENAAHISKAIKKSKSTFCAGHFEFNGFELFKGQLAKTHHDHLEYKKFEKVFSGHYHVMSSKDNVLYTGTPYELTWQDYGTTKGFFVLNDSADTELVNNPHSIYSIIELSKTPLPTSDMVTDKMVRLKIDIPMEPKEREAIIDVVYSMKPHDLKIIEFKTSTETLSEKTYDTTIRVSDMITDYIGDTQTSPNIDKDELTQIMLTLASEVM